MNRKIIIFIILIVATLIFLIYKKYSKINNGNELCAYFYDLGKSIANNTDFIHKKYEKNFFKKLPTEIKVNEIDEWKQVYDSFVENNITPNFFIENSYKISLWECTNINKEKYNKCMKPIINRILNETFIKSNLVKKVDSIIIHFRCADTPFIRHKGYHLQKYIYFKDALEEIKKTINNNKIIILYNNTHRSNVKNMNACNIYVNELKKYITNLGYEVSIESYSEFDDFAMMFYAPAVISTHSSFSFMSGFFGMGKFISAGHYYESDLNRKCKECDNWLYKGYDLNHAEVKDYYDTNTVINQLYNE